MNLLCFDVAGPLGSIAIFREEKCVHYSENPEKRTHAARLVSLIEEGLSHSQLAYQDLDAIVTCIGPGSFTGIRIGLATAKGLEIATGKPIIGLNAFDVSYWLSQRSLSSSLPTLIAIDALRIDVYCQLFYPDGSCKDPQNLEAHQILEYARAHKFILTGSGSDQVKDTLFEAGADLTVCQESFTAKELGEFVLNLSPLQREHFIRAPADPFYLRPTDINLKA